MVIDAENGMFDFDVINSELASWTLPLPDNHRFGRLFIIDSYSFLLAFLYYVN